MKNHVFVFIRVKEEKIILEGIYSKGRSYLNEKKQFDSEETFLIFFNEFKLSFKRKEFYIVDYKEYKEAILQNSTVDKILGFWRGEPNHKEYAYLQPDP